MLIFVKENTLLPNPCSLKEPHSKVCPSAFSVPTRPIVKICRKHSEFIQKRHFSGFTHPRHFALRRLGARWLRAARLTAFIRQRRCARRLHLRNLSQRLNLAGLQTRPDPIAAINPAGLSPRRPQRAFGATRLANALSGDGKGEFRSGERCSSVAPWCAAWHGREITALTAWYGVNSLQNRD